MDNIRPEVKPLFDVMVPNPARFALHKLFASQKRPKGQEAESIKDIRQADQLLDFLIAHSSRSYDIVEAWGNLHRRGKKWWAPVQAALSRCNDPVRHWILARDAR